MIARAALRPAGEAPGQPQRGLDRDWESAAEAAAAAVADGRHACCRKACEAGRRIAMAMSVTDPRRAAGLNNQGLCRLLAGDLAQARADLSTALEAWDRSDVWIATMKVESTARSSAHHIRLEDKFRGDYGGHNRARQRRLAAGGRAVAAFNYGVVLRLLGQASAAELMIETAVHARRRAFGERNPELRVMLAALAGRNVGCRTVRQHDAPARPPARDALGIWLGDRPARGNDSRRLLAAVTLSLIARTDWEG